MAFDFNNAEAPKDFDTIPAGTLAKLTMFIRPPEAALVGNDPLLTQSENGPLQYLDCEFTILFGPFANRKFWSNMMIDSLPGAELTAGQTTSIQISASTIRGILESARNVKTTDNTENGCAARSIQGYADLNGIEFAVKIGIEKSKDPQYADKNKILAVITPDSASYTAAMAGQDAGPAPGAGTTPAWGNGQPATQPAANGAQSWPKPAGSEQAPGTPAASAPADNTPAWAK
jgi:hypothetical protein